MKKELLLGFFILSVLVLAGCNNQQTNNEQVYVSFFNETNNSEPKLITVNETVSIKENVKVNTTPAVTGKAVSEVNKTVNKTTSPVKQEMNMSEVPKNAIVKRFTEGDLVSLKVKALDPDNDQLIVTYSPPLNSSGEWHTKVGDAGTYRVRVTVSDGKSTTSKEVIIIVEPKNKPPVIRIPSQITVHEGDTIVLKPNVTDPDGDNVTVTFSGLMNSSTYTTNYKEAGSYVETITATDGKNTVTKSITINILNTDRPPEISIQSPVIVTETQEVKLKPIVTDPDGDNVTVTYSGAVNSKGEWNTTIGDAGTYKAVITASDGQMTTTKDVKIIVKPLNRPPVIQRMKDITVYEGDTIKLRPVIIDPDGDNFTVTYSGWMDSDTYTTNYNDAGTYIVKVTATDTKGASSTQEVKITVLNKNRPPEILEIE